MSTDGALGASPPFVLTIEGDGDSRIWVVCSCGWLRDFGSAVGWGEAGWHVSQHADTHRSGRTPASGDGAAQ